MILLRVASLALLLAGILVRQGDARAADQPRTWRIFSPVPTPPVVYLPSAIAVGADGRVFVTDTANGTVQVLSPAGAALPQLAGSGQLAYPTGVAAGRDGAVYVADAGKGRLVRFSPSGQVVWSLQLPHAQRAGYFSSDGIDNGFAYYSMRTATGPGGNVYVLHGTGSGVWLSRASPSGRLLATRRLRPRQHHAKAELTEPLDLAIDGRGDIFILAATVVEPGGRPPDTVRYFFLQTWSFRGRLLREWNLGVEGPGDPGKSRLGLYPTTLTVGRRGDITLAGGDSTPWWGYTPSGIVQLSPSGRVVDSQRIAVCRGNRSEPSGLAADRAGTIYLVDRPGRSVQTFSPTLRPGALWGACSPRPFVWTWGLAVDAAGAVYVADVYGGQIVKLAPDGHELTAFGPRCPLAAQCPYFLAVDAAGEIYVAPAYENTVEVLSPAGTLLRRWKVDGSHIQGIVAGGQGPVYVSAVKCSHQLCMLSDRVWVFSRDGHLLARWGWGTTAPAGTAFQSAGALALDTQGDLYVVVDDGPAIVKLSPNGQVLARWTISGLADDVVSMGVDAHGNVYLIRVGVNIEAAVLELAPNGQVIGQWDITPGVLPGQLHAGSALAVDSRGDVYVAGGDEIDWLPAG